MKWFTNHLAYTISKYNMTMVALGLAAELKKYKIAANTLWPRTTIATAAVQNLLGGETLMKMSRTPQIVADAAYAILSRPSDTCTGTSFIDEEILEGEGVTDFDKTPWFRRKIVQRPVYLRLRYVIALFDKPLGAGFSSKCL